MYRMYRENYDYWYIFLNHLNHLCLIVIVIECFDVHRLNSQFFMVLFSGCKHQLIHHVAMWSLFTSTKLSDSLLLCQKYGWSLLRRAKTSAYWHNLRGSIRVCMGLIFYPGCFPLIPLKRTLPVISADAEHIWGECISGLQGVRSRPLGKGGKLMSFPVASDSHPMSSPQSWMILVGQLFAVAAPAFAGGLSGVQKEMKAGWSLNQLLRSKHEDWAMYGHVWWLGLVWLHGMHVESTKWSMHCVNAIYYKI